MNFHVRDRRASGWFWIDNEIVDRFLPKIGVYGFAVYNVLARFSKNGSTFVSHHSISKAVKCSPATVKMAIESLMEYGLLAVKSGKDKGVHNIYFLLTPPESSNPPGESSDPKENLIFLSGGKVIERGSQQTATSRVATKRLPPSQEGSHQETHPVDAPVATGWPDEPLPNIEEQDCKTNKTKNKAAGASELVLPPWLDIDAWSGFVEMRQRSKSKPTRRALELILKDLEKFEAQGLSSTEALNNSVKRGWLGVFAPDRNVQEGRSNGNSNGSYRPTATQSAVDQFKRDIDEAEASGRFGWGDR